jgi:hypothetical protein
MLMEDYPPGWTCEVIALRLWISREHAAREAERVLATGTGQH